jgi:mycothiol synthase
MQVVVHPAHRNGFDHVVDDLTGASLDAIAAAGGGHIDWWLYQPTDAITDRAAAHGFRFDRDLLQMRRRLPVGLRAAVVTRSFVVGHDEDAWLAVNNRAFAGHAEQGTWTVATLHHRMAQPWFDADGFRLHEREGRLAAFCWTKRHSATTGEIYVIGVDPDFQGLGLGKQLTLAGLDHLHDNGASDALLYVDGANVAARAMYERLGFAVHRTDRAFSFDV